jgi:LPXTG-site transpeptidase (sortase) family protein
MVGMRARIRWASARAAIATLLVLPALVAIAPAASSRPLVTAAAPAGASVFTPIPPNRLVDTRVPVGATPLGTPGDNGTINVQITGRAGIPANATAVVLNVTATNTTGPGFVTAYPAGQPLPLASNLNPERAAQNIPNLVTVKLGGGGQISIFTLTKADIVVDAFGYYTPATSAKAGRFVPAGPVRAFDSRNSGGPLPAGGVVNVPLKGFIGADATAVVLNVTATNAKADGYYTVWADGAPQPPTSNLNVEKGGTVPNQVIVPVSAGGVDVYTYGGGDVVVDVFGWFTGPSANESTDGLFVPITPTRFLDTRTDANPLGAKQRLFAGWTIEMGVIGRSGIPFSVGALVANTTIVNTRGPGFTTVYPAGTPQPLASNLNATEPAELIANHTTVPVGVRGVAFYSQVGSHIVVDVTGWYTGTPLPSTLLPPANPTPAAPPPPTRLVVPRLGLDTGLVAAQSLDDLVDDPGWLPGSGLTGSAGNMVIAGHRTSHTHPFYFIDTLQPGDEFYVYADGKYTYQVQGSVVVPGSDYNTIVAWTPDPTATLYACTPLGSTAERWVVKATYVGDAG